MTSCTRLSDRMIEVRYRGSSWQAREEEHLATCPACRAEWSLVQATARLGTRWPLPESDQLAAAVLARRRAAPGSGVRSIRLRRHWERWTLGLVAAATVVFAVGLGLQGPRGPETVSRPALLGELDDLSSDELETVLWGLDDRADPPLSLPAGPVGLSDLSEAELEQVLESLEG
jgi:hypothetical protein